MLMMLAPLAGIISVIGVPFLLLPLYWGRSLAFGFACVGVCPCHVCFAYAGANLAIWVVLVGG